MQVFCVFYLWLYFLLFNAYGLFCAPPHSSVLCSCLRPAFFFPFGTLLFFILPPLSSYTHPKKLCELLPHVVPHAVVLPPPPASLVRPPLTVFFISLFIVFPPTPSLLELGLILCPFPHKFCPPSYRPILPLSLTPTLGFCSLRKHWSSPTQFPLLPFPVPWTQGEYSLFVLDKRPPK